MVGHFPFAFEMCRGERVEPVADLIPQLVMQLSRIYQVDCSNLDVSFLPQQEKIVAESLGNDLQKLMNY